MATKNWVGLDAGNEGDWATAANWSASGVPADNDTVNLLSGTQGVVEGFSQGTIGLTALNIGGSLSGCDVGAASTPLVIGAVTTNIQTKNSVNVYLQGSAPAEAPLATVIVECQDADAYVSLAGYCTTIILRRGKLNVVGNFGTLIIEPLNGDMGNCSWEVGNATGTTIVNDGGAGKINHASAAITTLKGYGNSVTVVQEGTTTNVETAGSAIVEHNAPTGVTLITTYGASKVDTTKDLRAKTVTNWRKSKSSHALVGASVVLTNPVKGLAGDDLRSLTAIFTV